jgi:hypothetical protein
MAGKMKGLLPLAIVAAVLVFVWIMFTSNVNLGVKDFFWLTPAAFVTWGFYFAAGTGTPGFMKSAAGGVIGSLFGLALMWIAPNLSSMKSSSGLSLTAAVLAFVLVLGIAAGDWWYVPAAFGGFACTVFAWALSGYTGAPIMVWLSAAVALVLGSVFGLIHTNLAGMITPKSDG